MYTMPEEVYRRLQLRAREQAQAKVTTATVAAKQQAQATMVEQDRTHAIDRNIETEQVKDKKQTTDNKESEKGSDKQLKKQDEDNSTGRSERERGSVSTRQDSAGVARPQE